MKKTIEYHYIKSDHIFASPEFHHSEIVEVENEEKLTAYIESKVDDWGHPFKKEASFGFDFISNQGGVKVKDVKIKKI